MTTGAAVSATMARRRASRCMTAVLHSSVEEQDHGPVPGQSDHRWGVNGGAGLRIGGRVALVGEVRVFYFREYELRFEAEDGFDILEELLAGLAPVRFEPVFIN